MLTVTCVLSGLDFEAAGGSVVRYCLSDNLLREPLSRCKHDMGALLCFKRINTRKSAGSSARPAPANDQARRVMKVLLPAGAAR